MVDIEPEASTSSVGPKNIPGYDHVVHLAQYLVELRHAAELALTNVQANEVIRRWQMLHQYDKAKLVNAQRFQRQSTGRFKTSKKKSGVAPGVESTTRYSTVHYDYCIIIYIPEGSVFPN